MKQVVIFCMHVLLVHSVVSALSTDQDKDGQDKLLARLEILEKDRQKLNFVIQENKKLKSLVDSLEKRISSEVPRVKRQILGNLVSPDTDSSIDTESISLVSGAVYTRWGRSSCPEKSCLLYEGIMGGSYYKKGGGSNYLCLPRDPAWLNYTDGFQDGSRMYGVEFQIKKSPFLSKENAPAGLTTFNDEDTVCAVCQTSGRPTQLMIPAKTSCPDDWTLEYKGYLMSGNTGHQRSEFICVDEAPEVNASGTKKNKDGGLLYHVEAACGSLPCPSYADGLELACVVCSN